MNTTYARVSTLEQSEHGYSIADQVNRGRAFFAPEPVQEFVDDGYSGEFLDRPELNRLRELVQRKQVAKLWIADPDRLSRSLTNMLLLADEFEAAGVIVSFGTGSYDASPEGKLFFSMRGAIAEFEKAKIRERTMRGKKSKALQGKVIMNDKPFGYDWLPKESNYAINEEEAKAVRAMFHIYTTQGIGVRKVAEEMRSMGYRNREGKPFSPVHIWRMLKNEMYAGIKQSFRHYDKLIAQGKKKKTKRPEEDWISIPVPAIVDRETWEAAQKATGDNAIVSMRNVKYEYLVRNMVKCGHCGYAMIGYSGNGYQYYACIQKLSYPSVEKRSCPSHYIRTSILDQYVWDALKAWADGEADLNALVQSGGPDYTKQIQDIANRHSDLVSQQGEIVQWYRKKTISKEVADKELEAVNKEIAAAQSALDSLRRSQAEIKKQVSITPAQILSAVTFDDRRAILMQLSRDGFHITARRDSADIIWFFA